MNQENTTAVATEEEFLPLKRIQRRTLILSLIPLSAAIYLWPTFSILGGVVSGSFVGFFNFCFLRRMTTRLVGDTGDRQAQWGALFLMKMFGLLAVVALLILVIGVNPIAFTIGFSTVVAGICYEGVRSFF